MDNDNGGSYLSTHKYIRYLVFTAAFLGAMAMVILMFGQNRVAGWIENAASSAGYNITNPEGDKP